MTEPASASPALYPILADATVLPCGADEVGNKAWNLIRMATAGLPVPPGFVLPTAWCRKRQDGQASETQLSEALAAGVERIEAATGLAFASARKPLLVAVRSGAAVSMPGMLETVLDVGLNAESVDGMIRLTGNPRLAWDSYRRLIQGFAEIVAALPREPFDHLLRSALDDAGAGSERDLDHRRLRRLALAMLDEYRALAGAPFPDDPHEQLVRAASAVFQSWDAPKAATYRKLNAIDDAIGTAVTVQAMVFGNAGGESGAGVGFTRNPASGARELYLDFQFDAQGEDIVAGRLAAADTERLRQRLPRVWAELERAAQKLEALFKDAQDFEFTVQDGRLYLLQARNAKRTPWAALRILLDLVEEDRISRDEALARLRTLDTEAMVRTRFGGELPLAIGKAIVASIGVASGAVALDAAAAERIVGEGSDAILVSAETTTADIAGLAAAAGVLTGAGSRTSHAAVVARQLGKVCLVACPELSIDMQRRLCRIGDRTFAEGDFLSLDGNDGAIYPGRLEIMRERPERELATIATWRRSAA